MRMCFSQHSVVGMDQVPSIPYLKADGRSWAPQQGPHLIRGSLLVGKSSGLNAAGIRGVATGLHTVVDGLVTGGRNKSPNPKLLAQEAALGNCRSCGTMPSASKMAVASVAAASGLAFVAPVMQTAAPAARGHSAASSGAGAGNGQGKVTMAGAGPSGGTPWLHMAGTSGT